MADQFTVWGGQQIKPPELAVLGGVTWLSQFSNLHRCYPLNTFTQRILPAVANSDYLYMSKSNGAPLAFCCWARVSEEVRDLLKHHPRELRPDEWVSGNLVFFLEFIAPFGHTRQMAKKLRKDVFTEGETGFSFRMQPNDDGEIGQTFVLWRSG